MTQKQNTNTSQPNFFLPQSKNKIEMNADDSKVMQLVYAINDEWEMIVL